jgi:hypothetical protein
MCIFNLSVKALPLNSFSVNISKMKFNEGSCKIEISFPFKYKCYCIAFVIIRYSCLATSL